MRLRITATVALLVGLTLGGAGLIVYVIETQRLEAQATDEVDQELDEFVLLNRDGVNPETGESFASVRAVLTLFLERNVPNDDELLVGWVGDGPVIQSPEDPLSEDPAFQDAVRPLVTAGGTTRLETADGEVMVSSQPVRRRGERGALIVVVYLDNDRSELHDTMRTYAVVSGLSMLLLTLVAFWQSGRLLAPLRVLRATADEISETDLSRRIPLSGNDDITALTRTVNSMLGRLEAAFVGQREFLDDAGHELRTPLTVLRGHLELLDTGSPEEVAATKALLLDEVDRMSRLVGDLILLAKSDRPDFVTFSDVDLGELTEDVLAKARALGDRDWQLDEVGQATLHADGQRVTQALLQLADNAVKHTRPGDVVALGSSYDGSGARLWVRDTGAGVPATDRELVFERFGRAQVPEGDEGFGLGLSIVRAIVEAHGGTVAVEDAESSGALFVVRLPARAPSPTTEESAWPAS
ncbi:two-component sensor histidine kinase [Nocardioides szechwanensis]|uniref:histidine kinase n=1 Tax=Nocardioides szechwanensis TaxID=1005944 RepID=A0A1H0HEL8_9ACTN|nr:ATP-binding protein [Nocardioides szechwanensis]GEP34275.1 two-component sensor histidine kinase [Nocardioides szechwanensis]SDO17612.1 Signal transduction histidine kinase [Nocardioides szechwanensis]